MGKGVNKVILVGNLGRDPEVRYAQSGNAVCNLSLAIGERKKEGDNWVDHTEWVRAVCFGRTAENVAQYMSKGKQLYIEGRMETRQYKDKDGNDKWSTEVVAREVVFLGGGESQGQARSEPKQPSRDTQPRSGGRPGQGDQGFYDDDLPF